MENYSFVSEKEIGEDTYQAWRSDDNPSEVVVLKNGESISYEELFNQFWKEL